MTATAPPPCLSLTVTPRSTLPLGRWWSLPQYFHGFRNISEPWSHSTEQLRGNHRPCWTEGTQASAESERVTWEPAPAPPSPPHGPSSVVPKQGAPCSEASRVQLVLTPEPGTRPGSRAAGGKPRQGQWVELGLRTIKRKVVSQGGAGIAGHQVTEGSWTELSADIWEERGEGVKQEDSDSHSSRLRRQNPRSALGGAPHSPPGDSCMPPFHGLGNTSRILVPGLPASLPALFLRKTNSEFLSCCSGKYIFLKLISSRDAWLVTDRRSRSRSWVSAAQAGRERLPCLWVSGEPAVSPSQQRWSHLLTGLGS